MIIERLNVQAKGLQKEIGKLRPQGRRPRKLRGDEKRRLEHLERCLADALGLRDWWANKIAEIEAMCQGERFTHWSRDLETGKTLHFHVAPREMLNNTDGQFPSDVDWLRGWVRSLVNGGYITQEQADSLDLNPPIPPTIAEYNDDQAAKRKAETDFFAMLRAKIAAYTGTAGDYDHRALQIWNNRTPAPTFREDLERLVQGCSKIDILPGVLGNRVGAAAWVDRHWNYDDSHEQIIKYAQIAKQEQEDFADGEL